MTPTPITVAAFAALAAFATGASAADVTVVVDGNLKDLVGFAQELQASAPGDAIVEEDAAGDVRVYDPSIVAGRPIAEHYFANGFDQTYDVFAYDRASRTLYLGLRVAGSIGDADGDGNPDASAVTATVDDQPGIADGDLYVWTVRGADASASGAGGAREALAIAVTHAGVVLRGAPGAIGEFSFAGSDLEIVVRGIDLPKEFNARVAVGNLGDGLGEDTHALGAGDEPAVALPADEPALIAGETPERAHAAGAGSAAGPATEDDAARVGANGATGTDASVTGGLAPATDVVSDGIAVLGRAYPNPFSASVTFGFEVKAAGQSVDVGVYDVSGRMIAKLATGPYAAGRASVQWDGKDDGGVRMAPGVYFLRAVVGGVSKVQRLVRVDG